MNEYVERAKKLGLSGMGFSDHFPMVFLRRFFKPEEINDVPLEDYSMTPEEVPTYLQMVKTLQARFTTPGFEIKLGFELDYVRDQDAQIKSLITPHVADLDYIYGSIHFLYVKGRVFPFDDSRFKKIYDSVSIDDLHVLYFESLNKMVKSGIYDIVAHFDLLKKFNIRPLKRSNYETLVEESLSEIARSGMALELNTAGLRKPVNEFYPEDFILEICLEKKIPIVLGSDAHNPEEVGHEFKSAQSLLLKLGFTSTVNFKKRKQVLINLID